MNHRGLSHKRLSRILRGFLIFLAVLLLLLAVVPLIIPIPPLKDTLPPQQLADPDSHFFNWNGFQVHYRLAGQGEKAIILLHGFAASTFSWRLVMASLALNATVIAYDRPAFGLTERPLKWTGQNPYGSDAQIDLLLALMDAQRIEKAVLVGNSAGGALALLAALRYPERVQALVLVDPAIYLGGGGGFLPGWLRPLLKTPQFRRIGPWLVRSIQGWAYDFGRKAWHDPSLFTDEIWQGYRLPLRAENWDRGLWEFTLASTPLHLEKMLDQVKVPTLVITGDDDRIVPTENSVRASHEIPGAQLVVIPAAGHVPQEEQPAAFLKAVTNFLESLSPK
jgi:pimeloyl-ACP methyl ester carboxylesterase